MGERIPEVTEEAEAGAKPSCRSPGGGKQVRFARNKGGGDGTALRQA